MKPLPPLSSAIAAIALYLGTHDAHAASAAGMGIRRGGENVCGYTITWDGESDAELWMLLKETPLTFERDFEIPVDPEDPAKATLRGAIEIAARLRGDARATAKTDQLRFVRRDGRWYLSEEDIVRTLKLAGLAVPEPE